MQKKLIKLNINHEIKEFKVEQNLTLVELLKRKGYKGLRQACDGGNCGGCTVLIDKRPVLSCLMHCYQAIGKEILTIEGVIEYNEDLEKLPLAFKRAGSAQCGFCTCGFIMAAAGLYFKNSDPSYQEIITALSGNLCRCTGYEKIIKGARLFFNVINNREKIEPLKDESEPFGKPMEKVDGDILTRGIPLYVSDMNLPGQLTMKLLLSEKAHADIKNIDVTESEKVEGVRLILTHKNVPDINFSTAAQGYPEPSPSDTKLLNSKVRFHNEPVAAVVADNEDSALTAIQKINVEYEELPVILNFEDAYFNTKAKIHTDESIENIEDVNKNLTASFNFEQGRIEWSENIVTVEQKFSTSKQQHVHLEPHTAISYIDEKGIVNIYTSTQVPFDVQRIIAKILCLPFSKVRVIKPRIGGGFGGKQEIVVEGLTAYASYLTGRPVKYLMERRDEFSFARTRHPFEINLKLGVKKNGEIVNLKADILTDTGAYGGHASTVAELAAMRITQLYRVPNFSVNIKAVYTNKTPAGAFRGYGEPQVMYALESLVDEAASKLNMCPSELRKLNHIRQDDFLNVETLFVKPFPRGEKINTCLLDSLIEKGKNHIKWEERRPETEEIFTGKGMAVSMQGSGIPNITKSGAEVSLNKNGSITLRTGAVDIGTGADTILTQIAAQTLSVPMSKILLISSDTGRAPYDSGAYASNTTYFAGEAVFQACTKLKNAIINRVSEKYNLNKSETVMKNSSIVYGDKIFSLEETADKIISESNQGDMIFSAFVKKETHAPPFAAVFVDLNINKKTGKIIIEKIVQVLDCGKIINPVLAEGQVEGSTLQAIGFALYENLSYTGTGRIKEKDLLMYKIPTIFEKPEIVVEFVESYEPTGPYGIKSVGEVAFAPVPPAINNAIYDACGFHIYSLPVTPDKILDKFNA